MCFIQLSTTPPSKKHRYTNDASFPKHLNKFKLADWNPWTCLNGIWKG